MSERVPTTVGADDDAIRRRVTFVDASALVALADADDASHAAAVAAYTDLVTSDHRLFTTDLALTQAHDLLVAALGQDTARWWLSLCRIPAMCVEGGDLATARQMMTDDATSSLSSLTDAIHLAVLDRLGVTDVFAVDRRFLSVLG